MKNIKKSIEQYVFENTFLCAGCAVWVVSGLAMCFVASKLDADRVNHLAVTKELLIQTGLWEKMEKGEL